MNSESFQIKNVNLNIDDGTGDQEMNENGISDRQRKSRSNERRIDGTQIEMMDTPRRYACTHGILSVNEMIKTLNFGKFNEKSATKHQYLEYQTTDTPI